jgi:hypothetical protein
MEPPGLRARYLRDVRRATAQLAGLGRRVQGASEARAVAAIGADLPVYTGLMETARANNRQGFPVGAAYLREASNLMRGTILPAAGRLYAAEAQRLGGHQRTGSSTDGVIAALVVGLLALAVLVGAQVFVGFRMRRVFNVPLVAATGRERRLRQAGRAGHRRPHRPRDARRRARRRLPDRRVGRRGARLPRQRPGSGTPGG